MNLKKVDVKLIYDSSVDNIEQDLFIPLMKETVKYYRGVGFFSSNWIQIALEGIDNIINNNGQIYMITSPNLSEDDYQAILKGNQAKIDNIIYESIKKELEEFNTKDKKHILNYLSWLIADGILEMRFAICKNNEGIYHDKIAIFEDEENMVCIHGSINDSLKATYNGEAVSVFKSWSIGAEYCNEHKKRFMDLWEGKREFYKIITMPEKLKCTFREISKNTERPYKNRTEKREPRQYQLEAIKKLEENNWKGIFEMATGTGKTITSIFAMLKYKEKYQKQFLIVLAPFTHLVNQWEKELNDLGYKNILKCMNSKEKWFNKLTSKIKDYNSNLNNEICIISTYATAFTKDFYERIQKIKNNVCLIADECHYMGSENYQNMMLNNIDVRVGLSATPARWFDDEGTEKIKQYFDKTVYEYTLEEAIENEKLTPYYYYPVIINLEHEEEEEYKNLTQKISNCLNRKKQNKNQKDEYLEKLYRMRRKIINNANEKYVMLEKMFKDRMKKERISHTLVYCAKGESKKVVRILSNLGLKVHEFVYTVSPEDRKKILDKFAIGDYQVLVAIKCLDEGVDVPSTKTAYFMASTSNPREFIQRRGRILRLAENKKYAEIFDFLVFPNYESKNKSIGQNIIKKELPRFAEFSKYAKNKNKAREEIYDIVAEYNLEPRLNKLPWEVYKEIKEEMIDNEENEY